MTTPPRASAYAVPLNDPRYVAPPPKTGPALDPAELSIVLGPMTIKGGQITIADGCDPSAAALEVVRCINAAFGPVLGTKTVPLWSEGEIVNRHLAGAVNDGFKLAVKMCAGLARGVAEAFPVHAGAMLALAEGMEAHPAPLTEGPKS